jgi:hypothetical protein
MKEKKQKHTWQPVNPTPLNLTSGHNMKVEPLTVGEYVLNSTFYSGNCLTIALAREHSLDIFSLLCSLTSSNDSNAPDYQSHQALSQIYRTRSYVHLGSNMLGLASCSTNTAQMLPIVIHLLSLGRTKPIPLIPKFNSIFRFLTLYYSQLLLPVFPSHPSIMSSLFYHYNPFIKTFFRLGLQQFPLPPSLLELYTVTTHLSQRLRYLITIILYLQSPQQREDIFSKIESLYKPYLPFFEHIFEVDGQNPLIAANITSNSLTLFPKKVNPEYQIIPLLNQTDCEQHLLNGLYLPIPLIHNLLVEYDQYWWGNGSELESMVAEMKTTELTHSQVQSINTIFHRKNNNNVAALFQFPPESNNSNKSDPTMNSLEDETAQMVKLTSQCQQFKIGLDNFEFVSIGDNNQTNESLITSILANNFIQTYHNMWSIWGEYFWKNPFGADSVETSINSSILPEIILHPNQLIETFLSKYYPRSYHNTITKLKDDPNTQDVPHGQGEIGLFPLIYEEFYHYSPVSTSQGPVPFIAQLGPKGLLIPERSIDALGQSDSDIIYTAPLVSLALLDTISIITTGLLFRQPGELLNPSNSDQYYSYLEQLYQSGYESHRSQFGHDGAISSHVENNFDGPNQPTEHNHPSKPYYLIQENIPQPGETSNFTQLLIPGLLWWVLYSTTSFQYDEIMTILTHCRCDILNNYRQSTLMIAIAKQWPLSALMTLAKKMVNINLTDVWGRNVLHYYFMTGAYNRAPELFEYLIIECGVVMNKIDAFGHSPLSYALYTFAPTDLIKKLIHFTLVRFPKQVEHYYRFFEPNNFNQMTQDLISPRPFFHYQVNYKSEIALNNDSDSDNLMALVWPNNKSVIEPVYQRVVICNYDPNPQDLTTYSKSSSDIDICVAKCNSLNYLPSNDSKILGDNLGMETGHIPITGISINKAKRTFNALSSEQQSQIITPNQITLTIASQIPFHTIPMNYPFAVNFLAHSSYSNDLLHPLFTKSQFSDLDELKQTKIPTMKQRLLQKVVVSKPASKKPTRHINLINSPYNIYHDPSLTPEHCLISLVAIMLKLHYPNDLIMYLLNKIRYGIAMSTIYLNDVQKVINEAAAGNVGKKGDVNTKTRKEIIISESDTSPTLPFRPQNNPILQTRLPNLSQSVLNYQAIINSNTGLEENVERSGSTSFFGPSVFAGWNYGKLVNNKEEIQSQTVNGINFVQLIGDERFKKYQQIQQVNLQPGSIPPPPIFPNTSMHQLYSQEWIKIYHDSIDQILSAPNIEGAEEWVKLLLNGNLG